MEALAAILAGIVLVVTVLSLMRRRAEVRAPHEEMQADELEAYPPRVTNPAGHEPQLPDIPQEIRSYLEGILRDSGGYAELQPDNREAAIVRLFAELNRFISREFASTLPVETLSTLRKMKDDGRPAEEVFRFLLAELPNADQVILRIFQSFHDFHVCRLSSHCAEDHPAS